MNHEVKIICRPLAFMLHDSLFDIRYTSRKSDSFLARENCRKRLANGAKTRHAFRRGEFHVTRVFVTRVFVRGAATRLSEFQIEHGGSFRQESDPGPKHEVDRAHERIAEYFSNII